jgi:predicted RNase H-like HicB family nuclease
MKLEGRIWKDGNHWVVSVPILDISTQGRSKKDALAMIADAIQIETDREGLEIQTELSDKPGAFTVSANDPDLLIAFLLRRHRPRTGIARCGAVVCPEPQ